MGKRNFPHCVPSPVSAKPPPPSLRSTGTLAIRTHLQVRSNPVPGGQHTDYVSQGSTSTLDCFAAFHRYVSQVRWRLRKDGAPRAHHGQGVALPSTGAGASLIRGSGQLTLRRVGDDAHIVPRVNQFHILRGGAMWASPPTLDRKKCFRTGLLW
jgi:hypothetical protein